MFEQILLQTAAENGTEAAGSSLAHSLYKIPVTIGLSGALGSGKTAFMRGFLRGLGVDHPVTSPTYALEQRYDTPQGEVVHIDLYRLEEEEARRLLLSSEHHGGVRCIEWPEKAGETLHADIRVTITETTENDRTIEIAHSDLDWPDDDTIGAWRTELHVPANVSLHCDAVAAFCDQAADALIAQGTFVRKSLIHAAGKTHDLLRFWDFHPEAAPLGHVDSPEDRTAWEEWKKRYPAKTHEQAAWFFLRERGFPALADLVASHHILIPISKRTRTEEHLLYYADKRFIGDRLVSVKERYADFGQRYGNGKQSDESLRWEREALETQRLLFPDGIPF